MGSKFRSELWVEWRAWQPFCKPYTSHSETPNSTASHRYTWTIERRHEQNMHTPTPTFHKSSTVYAHKCTYVLVIVCWNKFISYATNVWAGTACRVMYGANWFKLVGSVSNVYVRLPLPYYSFCSHCEHHCSCQKPPNYPCCTKNRHKRENLQCCQSSSAIYFHSPCDVTMNWQKSSFDDVITYKLTDLGN